MTVPAAQYRALYSVLVEAMELFVGHSFELHLLPGLAHGVTEQWQAKWPPLVWSKWCSASEDCCALMSLLLIGVEEQW